MKSTLIELPPEAVSLEEDSYVEASSVEELAERTDVEEKVLGRLFLPGREIGPYRIVGYIASGGMGDIYAAERQMEDGRRLGPVALKVIAPELRGDWQIEERFKREAEISKAIRSSHVTRVYEFGESNEGHLFLSMELMRGEELFDRIITLRKLPEQEVARIFLSVLEGLNVVHTSGFIHRDLKPENIYFARRQYEPGETVKILDFGIAKRADAPSDPFLSVVGKIYGTPEYIAPEQGLNPDVDPRADLYSVGVMMHECLTGRLPFQGDTAYATILKHQNDPPPPLPDDVDEGLQQFIFRAMEKKPRDRYQSAEEMIIELRGWYVHHFDDELSKSLRDSAEMERPRLRSETPARAVNTPTEGTPVPNLMPTRRSRRNSNKGSGKTPTTAPPAQAAQPPATQSRELPAATDHDLDHDEVTSPIAGIITMIAVALIVLALAWAVLF